MYNELNKLIFRITDNKVIPAISVAIGYRGDIIYSNSSGSIFEVGEKITSTSKFDIASMTKILTGICFMKLMEKKYINLYDPICEIFPEFAEKKPIEKNGKVIDYCDASKINWYHVLTHTSGMGWTRPKTRPSLPNLNKGLADIYNLPFLYQTGEHIIYSDIPIILMGVAMEKITGIKLDELINTQICEPLDLGNTEYRRISKTKADNPLDILPTEYDTVFRKYRVWGEVHDENAFLLDGVAGHAGIFSSAEDMCNLAMAFADCLKKDGILSKETAKMMIKEQVVEDGDRRGLVWQLSGRSKNSYTRFLSSSAYGHSGFTGCFLWNDPQRDLSIVLLSNDVYNGRNNRKLFEYRENIMNFIIEEFDGMYRTK